MRVRFYLTCLRFLVYLASMSEEEINVAIAECCGWKGPKNPETLARIEGWDSQHWGCWILKPNGCLDSVHRIPNYCGDLNAMHEAEKVLQQRMEKWWNYTSQLAVVNSTLGVGGEAHATAPQRAEAFLRTLGKWIE